MEQAQVLPIGTQAIYSGSLKEVEGAVVEVVGRREVGRGGEVRYDLIIVAGPYEGHDMSSAGRGSLIVW